MKDTLQKRFRQTTAALVALTLVLSVFGPIGTVAADPSVSVTQSADSTTVNPGDTVTVTAELSVAELNAPQMTATTPEGWAIESQSADGPAAYKEGTWTWLAGDGDGVDVAYTVTYTVAVPNDASAGDYTISADGSALSPSDSSKTSDSASTTITVEEPDQNAPPTADAGSDQTVDEETSVELDASGSSDPDGDSLSYDWTVTNDADTSVSLSDADTATPTFTAPTVTAETTLDFEVEVSDGNGGSDTDTVSVTVQPVNDAPTVSISGPSSAQVGEDVTFTASASDDGSVESYDWDFDDGSSATGASASHTFSSAGTYDVTVTVTDDEGATETATQTVSVSEAPDPATFEVSNLNVPSPVTQGDSSTVTATVENTGDDEATQTVTISVDGTQTDSEDVTLAGDASQQVEFTVDTSDLSVGSHTVEVATDDDSVSEQLTVNEPSPPPSMPTSVSLSPTNSETYAGGTTTYDLVIDDAQGGVGAYTATVSVGDATVGEVVNVQLYGNPAGQTTNVDIAADNSSVTIDTALMDTADSGSVTVATITVEGASAGSTDLAASFSALGNEAGQSYTVTDSQGASLTVTEKSTTVSLSPSSAEVAVEDTTTYDVVVDNAQGGVGAYTATLSLGDSSVGSITDVELKGDPATGTTNVDIADDGSSVTIDAALMNTADTGSVTVATVTVAGDAAGSTDLSVSVDALGDEDANAYSVAGTNGASLTVTEVVVGDFANPVTDTDGDGEYEDINGDGTFDIIDIQALFANLEDESVQNHADKFDFNDDGKVDVVDVQALFAELIGDT
jgi:PKD repeat protein